MYKVASRNHQTVLHRGHLADWQTGQERLTLQDEYELLKSGNRALEVRIKTGANAAEKRRLGEQKLAMQNRAVELKKLLFADRPKKERKNLNDFIVDAAREAVNKFEWQRILATARTNYDAAEAATATAAGEEL